MSKSIFLFIPAIFIVLLLAAISSKYQLTPKSPPILPTITPAPSLFHKPPWQTYQDQNVSFVYPSTFEKEPLLSQGSGYTQEFNDNQNNLFLSFSSKGNYNQITGKAYSDIDEDVGLSYKVKEVIVDGQTGRQPLPRAGSENVFSAVFFSKDSKIIHTLELKAGDTTFNTPSEKVAEGESIFNQILSTFKFIDITNMKTTKSLNEEKLDSDFLAKSVAFGNGWKTSFEFMPSESTKSIIKKSPTGNGSTNYDPQLYEFQVMLGDPGSVVLAESRKVDLEKFVGKKVNISYRNISGVVYAEQQAVLIDTVSEDKDQNETANWKIYSDGTISFKYPSVWEIISNSSVLSEIKTTNNNYLTVVSELDNSKTITEYLIKKDKEAQTSYEVHSTQKTIINNLNSIQREEYLTAADVNRFATYFMSSNQNKITFFLAPVPGNSLKEDKILFDQILSTFKFLPEPSLTINAADPYNHHLNSKTVKIGYITNTYNKDNKVFIDINYIEWLNDKTSPDGYRIVDNNKLVRTFEISPQAQVYCLSTSHSGADLLILPDQLNSVLNNNGSIGCSDTALFRIDFDSGNKINWMRQVYTP